MNLDEEIKKICFQTAKKLQDFQTIPQIAAKKENRFMKGLLSPWDPLSLDYGYPALLVFFSEMDLVFPDFGWGKVCENLAFKLVEFVQENEVEDFSMFSGFTGACFAIQLISKRDSRYLDFDSTFRFFLMYHIEHHILIPMEKEEELGKRPLPLEFDGINGLPCFIFYLIAYQDQFEVRNLLDRIIHQIIRITKDSLMETNKVPNWHVNIQDPNVQQQIPLFARDQLLKSYPNGFFETGLAHGISGCLAALAKTLSSNLEQKGQKEAMYKIVRWLQNSKKKIEGLNSVWAKKLGFNPERPDFIEVKENQYFDGWAHGAPGILNSIMFAAYAMKDGCLMDYCIDEFFQMVERIQDKNTPRGLPFCYGYAGVIAILFNASFFAKKKKLAAFANLFVKGIVTQYQPEAPFGFKCIAPSNHEAEDLLIDNPGLLTGSIGVLLSLLMRFSKKNPEWLPIFLLR